MKAVKNLSDELSAMPYEGTTETTFVFDTDETLPVMLNGDGKQVTLLFNHLLSNALQYADSNPIVWNVRCERQKDNRLTISSDIPVIFFKARASRKKGQKDLGFDAAVHTPERLSVSIPSVYNASGKSVTKFLNHLLSNAVHID